MMKDPFYILTSEFEKLLNTPIDELKLLLDGAVIEKEYDKEVLPVLTICLLNFKNNFKTEEKEKHITRSIDNIAKYEAIEEWYYPILKNITENLFVNSFKWWLKRTEIDDPQKKENKKIFINKEIKNIDEILSTTESFFAIEYYFRIAIIYSLHLISPIESEEKLEEEISKLKASFLNKNKQIQPLQNDLPKSQINMNPFKAGIIRDLIKIEEQRSNNEIMLNGIKLIAGKFKHGFIDSLYSFKEDMLGINIERIRIIRARQIDNTYSYVPKTDSILLAFINSLLEYKRLLLLDSKKRVEVKNKHEKIKMVNLNIQNFIDYLIKKECFLKGDNEDLSKLFNGETLDKRLNFQININVLGTIFYELHENNKIITDKSITERWLICSFLTKEGDLLSPSSLHNILYIPDLIKSGRVRNQTRNHPIIKNMPLF